MENKMKNKKIAIYIAVLIALLGGSFVIYKIASASINNAVISDVTMTSIETGENLDSYGADNLNITCDNEGKNCVNSYTASKDSSSSNILVKSFDKIKYNFRLNVKDSTDDTNDVDDVKVNLRVTLNGDDSKYVTFDDNQCNSEGLCVIRNVSSYESTDYSLTLNVNNAPNGYEIHPTFTFDVEENNSDAGITLGYNEASDTKYFYSFDNGTYSTFGPSNYMPTIVSSANTDESIVLVGDNSFTQSANYDGKNGRFITYYVGIKLNSQELSGSYFDKDTLSFKARFTQDGNAEPIANTSWIRLYGTDVVDGIRSFETNLPYSTSSIGESSKYIKKPGNVIVTQEGSDYLITINNFELLLNRPTLNANNSEVNGNYIATIALTNFSPRLDSDGQNTINNSLNIAANGLMIGTKTIQNVYEQVGNSDATINQNNNEVDILTSSSWYDETETSKISEYRKGAVTRGTVVKYVTKFKNNKISSNQGLKEVIKFDIDAYRVLPYSDDKEIDIKVKCGKTDCDGINKDNFEVKFVTGSFDNTNYSLNDVASTKLSDSDKAIANLCSNIDLSSLNKDQIQNLYGGPCIKANENVEKVYDKINDASKKEGNSEVEIPISKVIVQTKDGVKIPDGAEVIVTVKARVRNVSDITRTYQATTMISTSDYDSSLYYYAPQINDAISPDNYTKTTYAYQAPYNSNGYIGDTLRIVDFTIRQDISVTNKNSDGSVKTKYRTVDNETITYKVSTKLIDNNIDVGADDSWYMRYIYTEVSIPNELIYIPDDDLIAPVGVYDDGEYTHLSYILVDIKDKIKPNMKINDIYFKVKLNPELSGKSQAIRVMSTPYAINVNGERDDSYGQEGYFTIYGTGINEVIGTQSIGESGSLIEKNGTINYVLNAYNNVGERVKDYTLIDILPYNGDENGTDFTGSYSVKVTSETVGLENIKCTKVAPAKINSNDEEIWEDCNNITSDFVEGVTAIRIDNIPIDYESYMGDIVVSLKTKDNKASDKYNNRFYGFTKTSSENSSNIIEASVINRTISGRAFLDNTGDGIKDGNETYISEIPLTLYKVGNDGVLKKISDTQTDENGYYEFNNLDKGRYKIRAKYDVNKYDLALRYATEDTNKDSDAYLIDSDGTVEISDKTETAKGLVLYPPVNAINNMDIGLQPKSTFGFIMNKYITRIDLTNNGNVTTTTYDNLSTVSINVLNPNKYTTKVYYGISITNNSNKAGYINLVKEDIPEGFIFDKNYPENAGWFEVDGVLGNRSLENKLVNPNETVYLQIVLFLPSRDEAGTFINTASVAEVTPYTPIVKDIKDQEYINDDEYQVGDSLRFAGVNFHVIGVTPNGNEQILTLLADYDPNEELYNHGNVAYRWSYSYINRNINNTWVKMHNIDLNALEDFYICDDASGLFNESANGGVVNATTCASNVYTTSKVRLLTAAEFNTLINNLTDTSFLLSGDFWLMDAVYATDNGNAHDEYGRVVSSYDTSDLAKYVKSSNSTVLPVQGTNGFDKDITVNSNLQVRPVIRISTHNIILE